MSVFAPAAGFLRRIGVLSQPPWRAPSQYPDSHVAGWVDGLADGRVSGWAFSTLAPRRRVTIVAQAGDRIVAETVADIYRADVDRAFAEADGYCGFSLALDRLPAASIRILAADFAICLSGAAIDLSPGVGAADDAAGRP